MFWDGADTPAVEAPLGDFFGQLHGLPPVQARLALPHHAVPRRLYGHLPHALPARRAYRGRGRPGHRGCRDRDADRLARVSVGISADAAAIPRPVPARISLRGLRAELSASRRRRPRTLPGLQLRRGGARRPCALVARGRRERLCDERRRRSGGTLRPSARRRRRGHVWRLLRRRAAPTVHASRPGRALLRPGRHRPGPRPAHAGRLSVLRGRRHPLRPVDPGAIRVDGKRHLQHGLLVPGTAPPAVRPDAGVGPTPAGCGAAVRRHGRAGTRAPVAAAGSVPS